MSNPNLSRLLSKRVILLCAVASLFVILTNPSRAAEPTGRGQLSGSVTSKSTGTALQGAAVVVPGLNRAALTDDTGRFVLYDLPSGAVEVVVSYSGFLEQTRTAIVQAGATVELPFDMVSSEVVALEKFTVTAVKEGQSLAQTEQRNAANVKNVVALDEWGVLPTQNVGELFSRMPGIAFTTDDDNLINNVTVRGMISSNGQSFTRLNVDGMSSTGVGGNGRTATLHSFSAAMYEQLEVIAGQTPDKDAGSIGGQINLKTRSPLAIKEKRRLSYNFGSRYIPNTVARTPALAEHPFGYTMTFGYTEVFDVFGGKRNLGVAANLAHQQVVTAYNYDTLLYPAVVDPNLAFFRDYTKLSGPNHRFITGLNLRADYRLSDSTTISARFVYNLGDEPFFVNVLANPFFNTNATIFDPLTNPAGGIVAGSNQTRTEIRPTGNAQMRLSAGSHLNFSSINPTGTLAFEHNRGRLKIDHAWRLSKTRWDSNSGRPRTGGTLNMRTAAPIGFILDNSNLDGRVFTQTAGPSVYDPASYAAFIVSNVNTTTIPVAQTSVNFVKRGYRTDTDEWSGNLNATYAFETTFPLSFKAGGTTVNREVNGRQSENRRWYALPGTVLSGLPLVSMTAFEDQHGGTRLPLFEAAAVDATLNDPTKWVEDTNFTATQRYSAARYMQESVDAGYFQFQTKLWGKLNVLAGVRYEKADVETATFFRARTTTIAAQPDHVLRAAGDFNRQTTQGGYTKSFPGIHLAYDVTPNLKARASWSNSYSRPDLLQLVPGVTVSDANQTVTIGNPDLKPQLADNIDLKLEYYFKQNGRFSVTAYRKNVTDYIPSGLNFAGTDTVPSTPDNGFDGLYGGYRIIEPQNIGKLRLQGVEAEFVQRLNFLPGALKGLTIRANYTYLEADGNFFFSTTQTAPIQRKTREIPGLVPHSGNLGLQYAYGKFGASFDVNYSGEYNDGVLATLNLNTPQFLQLFIYRKSLTTMNAGVTYRIRPDATLYLNAVNFTSEGPNRYSHDVGRPRRHTIAPVSVSFGITGQF